MAERSPVASIQDINSFDASVAMSSGFSPSNAIPEILNEASTKVTKKSVASKAKDFNDSKIRMDESEDDVEMYDASAMKEHMDNAQEYNKSYTIMGKEVDLFTIIGAILAGVVPVGLCVVCKKKEEKYDEMAE